MNTRYTYTSATTVPYTLIDRKILEIVCSQAMYRDEIIFEYKTFKKYFPDNATYRKKVDDSLNRIKMLTINGEAIQQYKSKGNTDTELERKYGKFQQFHGFNMLLFKAYIGDSNQNMAYCATTEFREYMKKAPVHNQDVYLQLSSVYEQDMYLSLVYRYYIMMKEQQNEIFITYDNLHDQYSDKLDKKHFKQKILETLFKLQNVHNVPLKIKRHEDGISFIRSDEVVDFKEQIGGTLFKEEL